MAQEGINHFAIAPLEELDNCLSREQMLEMEEELIQLYKPVYLILGYLLRQNILESPYLKALLSLKNVKCTCNNN